METADTLDMLVEIVTRFGRFVRRWLPFLLIANSGTLLVDGHYVQAVTSGIGFVWLYKREWERTR